MNSKIKNIKNHPCKLKLVTHYNENMLLTFKNDIMHQH